MPIVFFFGYFLAETLAFWAVARWIGVGWALVALFGTMFFGMAIAMWEVRRMLAGATARTPDGQTVLKAQRPGALAGNVGLTIIGGLLLSAPGFVSAVIGALLIFAPTRAVMRTVLSVSLFKRLEKTGMRIYEASPMAQHTESYGTFAPEGGAAGGAQPGLVIDEEELKSWTKDVRPEDFGDGR